MTTALEEVAKERSLDVGLFRQNLIHKMTVLFEGDEFVVCLELFISGLTDTMRIAYLNRLLNQEYIDSIRQAGVH